MNNKIDLSIIIVSWNVRDLLKKCLESIFKNQGRLNLEIFVVDNASEDGSVEEIEKFQNPPLIPPLARGGVGGVVPSLVRGGEGGLSSWQGGETGITSVKRGESEDDKNNPPLNQGGARGGWKVEIIENKRNLGFAKANNRAIKRARGEFILLLNPDTEVKPGTLEKMVKFMREHKECGVAGCKLLNADGSLQPSVRRFPFFWSQVMIMLKLHHLFPNDRVIRKYFAKDFDYRTEQGLRSGQSEQGLCSGQYINVDQVMGAFFIIQGEVIEKIGMLDEKFYIWFEEVDFCKRVKETDWKVYYTPEAEIIHYGAQSFNQLLSFKRQRIFNKSLLYYFKKHHSKFEWLGLWLLQPVSLALAGVAQIIRTKSR